ncbi:glycosyltransferase [Microbacterium sp. 2FI]|uniref:glycosyltransferase family 2 protein n=1 Tax=Microbacterium sp. 2FI TaxID=2502193 RepID=UPI0010F5D4F8|nr:glycosyltransferase [Microbacterium sp. 2FI]
MHTTHVATTSVAVRTVAPARWWLPGAVAGSVFALISIAAAAGALDVPASGTPAWWAVTAFTHLPFVVIVVFLSAGTVERVGYFWRGRRAAAPGRLPNDVPTVCVQLPMFNEDAVASRVISAVARLQWPAHRLEVQVLDDSTDPVARAIVDAACERARRERGVEISILRREVRQGYKAGALEAGRRRTDAEFIAIFDADFLPTPDFLAKTVPHFYRGDGTADESLALVQAQWGHLNEDESALTRAQALWVDDHHTVQMSWRSARWGFVNFTGTAGVWRASAIEVAGGWRAASLVEDCELSFRHLFHGYRTTFVRDVVALAELPSTYTAYKAQQKRWTQGWAQVQRLHLRTLATRHDDVPLRKAHLLYHMCIPWQWPAWMLWIMTLPVLIHTGLWLGTWGAGVGIVLYLLPPVVWVIGATLVASIETRDLYAAGPRRRVPWRRLGRIVPYVIISTGMLPHQFTAFTEGLLGSLHSEFERTPKSASIAAQPGQSPAASRVRIHRPYVVTEIFFVIFQLSWGAVFALQGMIYPALTAIAIAVCVVALGTRYGDDAGPRVVGIRRPSTVAVTPSAARG